MSIKKNTQVREEEQSQIKVYIRIRPFRNQLSKRCLKLIQKGVALNFKDKIHQLYYDQVFDQETKQERVFSHACKPILNHVLQGNNGAIFVYGQTGTGKTYTMGTLEAIKRQDQGLIPLSLKYLFQELVNQKDDGDWSISLSFMQIYMEQIYDLLNPRNGKLQIRQDLQMGEVYVQDLTIVPINNYKQSIQLLNAGLEYRVTGNQKMNQLSSRSHTIVTIYVAQKLNSTQYLSSNFSLIDLAGSQRVKKSNSVGIRLQEAKFINTSLSALGNVIAGLSQNDPEKFIPYRSSKLTRILKNSLSGKSRVSVICTLQISEENCNQTYSTLLFADRCKEIRFANQPVINIQQFQFMGQEKQLKQQLERIKGKEKQYLQTIRTLQSKGPQVQVVAKQSERENQLGQVIQSVYKLFSEINGHLKKVSTVNQEKTLFNDLPKQKPKVTKTTPIKQIKSTITSMAQQTIDYINNLSGLAIANKNSKNNIESQTLSSIILQQVRNNLKLYENLQIQQGKQSLQKQIAIQQYQKQIKQNILTKLKDKKLKIVSYFQQIWNQNDVISNPLQSLLNNLRKGQLTITQSIRRTDINQSEIRNEIEPTENNPKDILKRMTKLQSERKQKYLNQSAIKNNLGESRQSDLKNSGLKYFQKSGNGKEKLKQSPNQKNTSTNQIKKLLDSLMVQKNIYEQKKAN